ncbi:MAG: Lipid carrier : UDP-N-acetylgalactosaminyltransferase (EC / Alpha-1,3-N-acetylgalactosamine transferase PglA (EC; Putative glycosyltransferase [uncultured Caballeronia sp.]|nr:MAG: Lipid carrier : UDP-N-acetylgalactosaminyltransferase (EC / Alpha-1,3-N-acetylgalactosamine transferase PglA (EC; Putative glycosyltransferase [uncultured Caballeronia sp.]
MNAEKSRLRIALVCNTAWAIYTYRRGLLRMLIEHGVEVSVIAPRDRTFAPLEEMGCRCVELPVASKGTNPRDDLKTLAALYREYRATQPHMVFHYTIKPNIYGSIAAKLVGIPSIAVTTGLGYVFIQKSRTASVAKRLYRFAFRFPREVWFLNQDDRQAFIDQNLLVHSDRARLLHGEGVDLDDYAFQPLPRANPQTEGFFFILIGRLLWDKGIAEYVNAARRLRLTYPYAWFQLLGSVGVDNPSAITLDEVQAWQREGVIDYLGEAHDVRAFIGNADCVVLPSYREGVPRTLMEASAMGRPIVATDVPGCREVVENGVTGLLCEVKSADSLAQQLERLLLSSHMARAEMGVAGRAKVAREFDENAIVERYKGTIRAVTGVSL